jgi:adenylate kinase
MRVFVILGGLPGSGKGTQAKRLAALADWRHISCGELFRRHVAEHTAFGLLAQRYIAAGKLTPDADTTAMMLGHMGSLPSGRFIIEGFPRTLPQMAAFEDFCTASGDLLCGAIYLDVPTEELVRRISGRLTCATCGAIYHLEHAAPREHGRCDVDGGLLAARPDDAPELVGARIELYEAEEHAVIRRLEALDLLERVPATGSIAKVSDRLAAEFARLTP